MLRAFEISVPARPRQTCRIRVGPGVLDTCAEELAEHWRGRRLVLISDETVASLHGEPFRRRLEGRGLRTDLLHFPPGELHKSRRWRDRLEDGLLRLHVGRDAVVLALGGGVTGDLAGLVASTWHRGIPVVQLPTTLLSMVDSALGGKTAINLPGGKNLLGTFHQPWGIYADLDVLSTLPEQRFREGLAELVKTAAVADAKLFRWLEAEHTALQARATPALLKAVAACLSIKGRVVRRDERDSGPRAILNFGHTVGHAIESAADYGIAHGSAVALGLRVEGQLAVEQAGFPDAHRRRLDALLSALDLPARLPAELSIDAVIAAARRDKKSRRGELRCALPLRLGRAGAGDRVTVEVPEPRLRAALQALDADDPPKIPSN